MRRHTTAGPIAFLIVGLLGLGLSVGVRPTSAAAGTPLPGAPNCPMFPADNVWNTPIAGLPVNPNSAAWLASMDAGSTNLHPDFGPSGDPATPYGIPYTVVSPSQPQVPITFQYADESDPGPYPFSASTPDRGRAGSRRGPARHHGQPLHLHPLRIVGRAVLRGGLDGRLGRHLEPRFRRAAPGRLDVGGRGRPSHPPRPRPLRRGAVGRHHPRHPYDGRGNRHVVPVAGAPRGGVVVEPEPAAHGGAVPPEGRLQHLGLLGPGAGRAARHAAVRADSGRQRFQLVLRGDGGRQLAERARQRAQAGTGQRVRGGRRVGAHDRPQLGAGPPARRRGQLRVRTRVPHGGDRRRHLLVLPVVPRLHGRPAPQRTDGGHGRDPR